MQRKFLSNLVLLLAINLLVKPFWILGIDRNVQNTVGFDAYGIYANIFTFSLILSVILDLGINNFASASIARNRQSLGDIFMPLFGVKLLFGVLYLGCTLIAGWLYGFRAHALGWLMLLSFNQLLAYLSTFFRSNLQGLQLFRTDAWLSAADRFAMSILGIGMLWSHWFNTSIETFIFIQTGGYLVATLLSAACLLPHLQGIAFRIRPADIMGVVRRAWPYALLALLMMCYTRIDNILIKKLAINGDLENGIYAAGGRLLEAANMLAVMVSTMLLPAFAALLARRETVLPLLKLAMLLLLVPAIAVGAWCWFYREAIIIRLYPEADAYAANVFGLQMQSYVMLAGMYVFGTLLTAKEEMKLLTRLAAIALLLNIGLNLALVPGLGAKGAAQAGLATQGFIFFTNMWFALRRVPTGPPRMFMLPYGCFAIFVYILMEILSLLHVSAITALIVAVPAVLLFLFVSGLLRPAQLKEQLSALKARARLAGR